MHKLGPFRRMNWRFVLGCLCWLVALGEPISAQESQPAEKIRDRSPDGRFAVRILYDAKTNQKIAAEYQDAPAGVIYSEAVHAIEVVTMPNKDVVVKLLGEYAGGFSLDNIAIVWSPDSKAFAYCFDENRVSHVGVEEFRDDKFEVANEPDELMVEVKDAFTSHARPVRWLKPGVLLLEQRSAFRDEKRPLLRLQLTAAKDKQTGKYKIVSSKRVGSAARRGAGSLGDE
jgi:hypothetical protein